MPIEKDELLLEEWKQNVALYIDQDKRGLERLKIFLTMNAGLLVFYGLMWQAHRDLSSVIGAVLIAIAGFFLTYITQRMSRKAHAAILLRKMQAMLIESKLKQMMEPDKAWATASGIITTFTREHVSFKGEYLQGDRWAHAKEWQPLLDEVKALGEFPSDPIFAKGRFEDSMDHLRWLDLLHYALYSLWVALTILVIASHPWCS
jgi:hypothetical protein